MDFVVILGIVGSVASIVALLLPLQNRHQRLIHLLYGLAVVGLSVVSVWYWQQNNRVRSVERAATTLVTHASSDYTHEGFILASLAFLEKNKDLYPDAYARAQKLCPDNACLNSSASTEAVHISFALQGLLKGIGTLEGGA